MWCGLALGGAFAVAGIEAAKREHARVIAEEYHTTRKEFAPFVTTAGCWDHIGYTITPSGALKDRFRWVSVE